MVAERKAFEAKAQAQVEATKSLRTAIAQWQKKLEVEKPKAV